MCYPKIKLNPRVLGFCFILSCALYDASIPVKEKDYPCEQTVVKAEANENATCNTQQPGATAEHQPPSRSACSMTLRTNFVSQLEVCHSEFEVSAGTDIVPIESWLRTGGEADQHPHTLYLNILPLVL